jgi:hypothetical protein
MLQAKGNLTVPDHRTVAGGVAFGQRKNRLPDCHPLPQTKEFRNAAGKIIKPAQGEE